MRFRSALTALAFVLPGAVLAQYPSKPNCEANKDPANQLACMDQHSDCTTPSWLSAAARAECSAEDGAKQRGLADHRRRRLEAVLTSSEKAKLKTADVAYERFAKVQCELEAEHVVGGSMYVGEVNSCMQHLKDKRLDEYVRMQKNFALLRNR